MNDPIMAYIGLGSNLTQPARQINQAHQALQSSDQIIEIAFSSLYTSPSMGIDKQPDYINAVMAITTTLSPMTLLRQLQTIENNQGRVRTVHWGARTLDLDLLLYGQQQLNLPELIVPHLGLSQRAFVLYPLQEIAPDLNIPTLGAIQALVTDCPLAGLQKQ
jgi:2-amino-4-hydroxy-6-hydroxymethyldihydropteridine diphosphokinase